MPQMLLLNPRKRRASGAKRRKTRSPAQRAATRRMLAANRAGRRSNPAPKRRRARRASPVVSYRRRRNPSPLRAYRKMRRSRRRNPIGGRMGSLFNFRSYLGPIKDAAVMGVGAVAVDWAFSYINPMLPQSLKRVPGQVGLGDLVKAVITVALGRALSGPTRGMSNKAAMGSLVVQMRDIAVTFLPMGAGATVNGLGFVTPGRVVPGMNGRVNSNMVSNRSPLLSQTFAVNRSTSPGLSRMYPTTGPSAFNTAAPLAIRQVRRV